MRARGIAAVFALSAVLAAAAPPPRASKPGPSFARPPLWRLNLRSLGLAPGRALAPLEAASASLHPLIFSCAGRLAVAFLTYAAAPRLTRRGAAAPPPLLLHLAVVDAASGRLLAHTALPAPSASVDVVAAPDGSFVVVEPRALLKLSPALQPVATRRFGPPAGLEARNERVLAAPDGASFVLSLAGPNWREDRWLRTSDLATLAHRQGDRVLAVNDTAIVRELPVRAARLTPAQALARERGICASPAPPRPLTAVTARLPVIDLTAVCSPAGALLAAAPPRLDATGIEGFLADGLLLTREFPGIALYDTGFTLIRERRPRHDATADGAPAVAAAGAAFALPVWVASAGMSVLDMQGFARLDRIAVVDAAADRMLELKTKGKRVAHLDGLALSPDAAKLAVLHAGVLQVFALPPPGRGWKPFDNRNKR
jgi:uncharacterized metal-binding protein